jgi:hypothetical protein
MAFKTSQARDEIYRLSKSADQRDRDLANTRAVANNPMPDKRIGFLGDALTELRKAVKAPYNREPETERLEESITQIHIIREEIRKHYAELKAQEEAYVQEDEVRRQAALAKGAMPSHSGTASR